MANSLEDEDWIRTDFLKEQALKRTREKFEANKTAIPPSPLVTDDAELVTPFSSGT